MASLAFVVTASLGCAADSKRDEQDAVPSPAEIGDDDAIHLDPWPAIPVDKNGAGTFVFAVDHTAIMTTAAP
jgi:hypothetical protein